MKVTALQVRTAVFLLALSFGLSSSRAMGQEPAPAEPSFPAIAAAPPADPAEIIRRVAAHEEENEKKERNYTYQQKVVEKKLDGQGDIAKTETRGSEVMIIYGEHVERQITKDDRPLPAKDAAKEEEKINKLLEKYKNETESERAKRLEKAEKEREESRAFVKEIADAFDFTMLPPETVDGHSLYVIQAEPKPGYQPHVKDGKYLTKFHGKVWIDQNEYQWVKLDLETLDDISFGWFIARFHKGSRLYLEQTRVNDEVWLPKLVRLNLSARILLKGMNYDVTQTYSDYKKFGSQSRIVAMGDAEPEKP